MIKVFILSLVFISVVLAQEPQREEIGSKAYIHLIKQDMNFLARIDSGARITSLHAVNIKLEGKKTLIQVKKLRKLEGMPFRKKHKNENYKRNIGRLISFDTQNELGQTKHVKAMVVNVVKVRNAQGVEYRYVIRLGLKYRGVCKYKTVNLRDRSNMTYKLLVGRNWLNEDFMIKTDKTLIK